MDAKEIVGLYKRAHRRRFSATLLTKSEENIQRHLDKGWEPESLLQEIIPHPGLSLHTWSPEAKSHKEKDEGTIGLLEKVLAQTLEEKYVPRLVDSMEQQLVQRTGKALREICFSYEGRETPDGEAVHEEFETVATLVSANEPVMLVGPAGSGKNVLCQQVATLLGLDFHFTNSVTQEYKLTGFIDANGRYHETEFYRAFVNGGLFMLDEIDASVPETLIILNAAIANRYFDFPTGRVQAHPNFRLVAAGNTYGQGADFTYTGRNQLDGASLNRFAVVEIGYSPIIESRISTDRDLIELVRSFRSQVREKGLNQVVSYRDLSRLDKMLRGTKLDRRKVFKVCLTKGIGKDELAMVKKGLPAGNPYLEFI